MRKVNVCLVWTLIFKLQFIEILSLCYDHNYKRTSVFPNIECNFENIYLPEEYPIYQTLQTTLRTKNYAKIKINRSFIPQLDKDAFNVTFKYDIPVVILEITNSQMTEIDLKAFVGFSSLLKLKLDYSDLTEIQQIFQTQTNLSELSLSHNNISWIDFDAFKPQKNTLKLLDLSFNSLDSTSILSNFDTYNESRSLFSFSKYLENLDLSNNQLEVLDRGTFSNNSNLLYLNLSRNSLTEIKLRVFDKLTKLIYLNLSSNSISKLDLGFSIGLKSLQTLDLSFNRLSVLDPNVFQNTPKLIDLQLHNNFLKNISIIDLKHSTTLQSISIHDNNIDCSLLVKMLKVLKGANIIVDEGSATESYSFHGISCNFSSTTEKSLQLTTNFQYSNKEPSETPPPREDFLENFEDVFLNSTFYGMFSEFVKYQKEKLDILTDFKEEMYSEKSAEMERNQNLFMDKLKEITLNVKLENETVVLELLRNLAEIALKDKSQNETLILEITRNHEKIISASISEGNQQTEKQLKNLQNVLIAFMKDIKAKPSDTNNTPSNFFYIFNNIFLIIIISLLAFIIYLSYNFLTNRKFLKDSKEMQPII